jgi:hypothetical protein
VHDREHDHRHSKDDGERQREPLLQIDEHQRRDERPRLARR